MYGCGVRLCLYFSVSCLANEFYDNYELFTADSSSQHVFGYSDSLGCIVDTQSDALLVQLHVIGTFQRSAPVRIYSGSDTRNLRVDACFEHDGHSNLIVRNLSTNTTLIIGAGSLKHLNLSYELLRYDHIYGNVHLVQNGVLTTHRVTDILKNNGSLMALTRREFVNHYDDFMVVENNIFILTKKTLYRMEGDGGLAYVIDTNTDTLWFQLFPKNRSLLRAAKQIPATLLYVVQVGMILFLVYCLRYRLVIRGRKTIYELVPPPIIKKPADGSFVS